MEYNLSLFVFFVFEKIEVKGVYGRRTSERSKIRSEKVGRVRQFS